MELTQKRLQELFYYTDGKLYRKTNRGGAKKDSAVGYMRKDNYLEARVDRKLYLVHRLIFLFHNEKFAETFDFYTQVDHINQDKTDNRIENLRLVTISKNGFNRKNIKGYYFDKRRGKYQAQITVNKKHISLGMHYTEEEAKEAYKKGKKTYHIF